MSKITHQGRYVGIPLIWDLVDKAHPPCSSHPNLHYSCASSVLAVHHQTLLVMVAEVSLPLELVYNVESCRYFVGDFELAGPRHLLHVTRHKVPVGTGVVREVQLVKRSEKGRLVWAAVCSWSVRIAKSPSGGIRARIQRAVQDPYLPLNATRSSRVTSSVLSAIGNFRDQRKGGAPTRWPGKMQGRIKKKDTLERNWKEVLTIYLAPSLECTERLP